MLDDALKTQLKDTFSRLDRTVRITAWLDATDASAEVRALLGDLADASARIELVEAEAEGERTPSFGLHLPGEPVRVRFAGLPLGHELTSLVLAVLHVGGHPAKEAAETLAQARELEGTYAFETYFSRSCQNCPDVVQALNLLAALNPGVTHTAIDGAVFQAEVEQRQVMAVPAVFLNGQPFASGRMDLAELLSKVDAGAEARRAQALGERAAFDLLVVGGGPAGAAAGIYAARKGIDTGLVTDRIGGQVLDTLAIENFVSVAQTDGPRFAKALEAHLGEYPVELVPRQKARRLVPADAPGGLHTVELESGAVLKARSVVLAPGARWRNMNVPGEAEYRTRGVTYCPHCDGPLFKGKRVAVVGGGNSGVEAAIDLAGVVAHVTVLEFLEDLKADDVLRRRLASLPNVDVVTMARTTEVVGDGEKVTGLTYEDRRSGETRRIDLDGVFVQIGLLPNTDWLKGTVALAPSGEIEVDARGATSVPGVFAAGDATTVPYKQIVIATGEGAKAALSAFDHLIRTAAPRAAA